MTRPLRIWAPAILVALPLALALAAAALVSAIATSAQGGSMSVVSIAQAEYDSGAADGDFHSGGEKYWSSFGFGSRVEWCGCFVGWCSRKAGLVPGESMPEWAPWAANWAEFYDTHPEAGEVHENDGEYMPKPGDIAVNGALDASWSTHVGIVERAEDGYIYTIEGNYGDQVQKAVYFAGDGCWTYFSTPKWPHGSGSGPGSLMEGVDWSVGEKAFVEEWAGRIDAWYATYYPSAPLGGRGRAFAKSAWDNRIDPRLVAAISIVESSGGQVCWTDYNAWGWAAADGAYDYDAGTFGSWEQGIEAVSSGLARGYSDLDTVDAVSRRYCPPNHEMWAEMVSYNMARM